MPNWVHMNFNDAQWAPLLGHCRETPIYGYVSLRGAARKTAAWALSVSKGASMTPSASTGLFFTKFRCGSARPTSSVTLKFELLAPLSFRAVHFTLRGSVGLANEHVTWRVGAGNAVAVPDSAGVVHYVGSATPAAAQRVLTITSTAAEMNLLELSWLPAGLLP